MITPILCSILLTAAAPSLPVVAVFDIAVDAKTPAVLGRKLTDQLRVELATTKKVIVVDRGEQELRLKELLREQKEASYKPCVDESCQIPLGKELAAKQIVRPMIARFGDRIVLSAEVIDVATGGSAGGASVEATSDESELLDAVRLLALRLTGTGELQGGSGETVYVGATLAARVRAIGGKGGGDDGIIRFETEPSGLAVWVDGRKLAGATPLEDFLPLGMHKVRVAGEGAEESRLVPHEEEVDLKAGMTLSVRLELVRGEVVVVARDEKGQLVRDVPVIFDGKPVAKAPVRLKGIEVGQHTMVLQTDYGAKTERRFALKSKEPLRLEVIVVSEEGLKTGALTGIHSKHGECYRPEVLCTDKLMMALEPSGAYNASCEPSTMHSYDDWKNANADERGDFCDLEFKKRKEPTKNYAAFYKRCVEKGVCVRKLSELEIIDGEKQTRPIFR